MLLCTLCTGKDLRVKLFATSEKNLDLAREFLSHKKNVKRIHDGIVKGVHTLKRIRRGFADKKGTSVK
jgi:hypothetical protein